MILTSLAAVLYDTKSHYMINTNKNEFKALKVQIKRKLKRNRSFSHDRKRNESQELLKMKHNRISLYN